MAGVEWRAARWFALQVGWNVLDVRYEEYTGTHRFEWNLQFRGPYVGFVFLF